MVQSLDCIWPHLDCQAALRQSAEPFGPPLIGALLRTPWEAVQRHILERLHERGFDDFDAAYLPVFTYPGPQGTRPTELAARMRISKQALNYVLGELERLATSNAPRPGRPARQAYRPHASRNVGRPRDPRGRLGDGGSSGRAGSARSASRSSDASCSISTRRRMTSLLRTPAAPTRDLPARGSEGVEGGDPV